MAVVRHLVLDNAAAAALLSRKPNDRRRREVVKAIAAANGSRVVPTAVRAEAGWDRTAPAAADANRLLPATTDTALDTGTADRVVALRAAIPAASVVDATVVAAADRVGQGGGFVEVLTSDVPDLRSLAANVAAKIVVTKL